METVNLKFRPAWRGFYLSLVLFVIVIIAAIYFNPSKIVWYSIAVIEIAILISIWARRMASKLEIHDNPGKKEEQEIEYSQYNFLSPANFEKSIQINFSQIVDIAIRKSIIQKILGVGDLIITSSGTGNAEIVASNMSNPESIREEIQKRAGQYNH